MEENVLVVFVVEIRNLTSLPNEKNFYCLLETSFNSQHFEFEFSHETLKPTWNTTCQIFVEDQELEFGEIIATLYSREKKKKIVVGQSRIKINKYADGKPYSQWFSLIKHSNSFKKRDSVNSKGSPTGAEINLKFQYKQSLSKKEEKQALGDYKFGEIVGRGKYSEVYSASKGDQIYAIKCLDKETLSETEYDFLKREVSIMKRLNHPNIVRMYEFIEEKDHLYLILEYVSGGELLKVLSCRPSFSEKEAAQIMKQILRAVQYFHNLGIAHRDLKPANILVSDDKEDKIKIIDFGLSKDSENGRSAFFTICGTPDYMAPEVIEGEAYGVECDIWSLGVIAYILLCGFPPFRRPDEDNKPNNLVSNILSANYSFPSPYFDRVSNNAKEFIRNVFVLNPKERWTAEHCLQSSWIKNSTLERSESQVDMSLLKEYTKGYYRM